MTGALLQDKAVIVIGGGDTGTDCIGTSVRHGAKQVWPSFASCATGNILTLPCWVPTALAGTGAFSAMLASQRKGRQLCAHLWCNINRIACLTSSPGVQSFLMANPCTSAGDQPGADGQAARVTSSQQPLAYVAAHLPHRLWPR